MPFPLAVVLPAIKAALPYVAMALPSIVNLFSSTGGQASPDDLARSIEGPAREMSNRSGISIEEARKHIATAMAPQLERMGASPGALETLATLAGIAIPGAFAFKAVKGVMAAAKAAPVVAGEMAAAKAAPVVAGEMAAAKAVTPGATVRDDTYRAGFTSPRNEAMMRGAGDSVTSGGRPGMEVATRPGPTMERGFQLEGDPRTTLENVGGFRRTRVRDVDFEVTGREPGTILGYQGPAGYLSNESLDREFANTLTQRRRSAPGAWQYALGSE